MICSCRYAAKGVAVIWHFKFSALVDRELLHTMPAAGGVRAGFEVCNGRMVLVVLYPVVRVEKPPTDLFAGFLGPLLGEQGQSQDL